MRLFLKPMKGSIRGHFSRVYFWIWFLCILFCVACCAFSKVTNYKKNWQNDSEMRRDIDLQDKRLDKLERCFGYGN